MLRLLQARGCRKSRYLLHSRKDTASVGVYPLSGQGVIFDPPQVLGSYVGPTVGAYCLLAT
jgi:hypothetical protein